MVKVLGVTGWKNSGKTTLVVKLVNYFVGQGLRVGTIKHAHCGFDIDQPETDSYRHREAGAQKVMIASSNRWAMMHELQDEDEVPLSQLLTHFSDLDLVIVEGYKRDIHPKIQTVRPSISLKLMNTETAHNIVALAAESQVNPADFNFKGPVLDLNDTEEIVAYICGYLDLDLDLVK